MYMLNNFLPKYVSSPKKGSAFLENREMQERKETINFGEHLMLDGYDGDSKKLDSKELVLKFLDELPEITGMKKIIQPVIQDFPGNKAKDPGGFSGFVIIAESHFSLHTFPKRKFASADIYTCKNGLAKEIIEKYFKDLFSFKDIEINFVKRGTKYPADNLE